MIACYLHDHPSTCVFLRRIARNHAQCLIHPRTSSKTAVDRRVWECVTWPHQNILNFNGLEIVKYVQQAIASWQHVLQRSHETQVICFFVLVTVWKYRSLFLVLSRHKCSTSATTTLILTYGFFLRCTSLVIIEPLLTSKVPVAFLAGNAYIFKCARRTRHAFTTRLVAFVRHVFPTTIVTRFTDVLS